jgi:hypothetical protein
VDEIAQELKEIGSIIDRAHLIDAIKHETRLALDGQRAIVTGGDMADAPQFDVVIRHRAGLQASEDIVRRLKNVIANVEVSHIENIANNLVGIKRRK